jgi:hypothetical protein
VFLHICSETLELCETKYLNSSHWLVGSMDSFLIVVEFIPVAVTTVSTVAVTL